MERFFARCLFVGLPAISLGSLAGIAHQGIGVAVTGVLLLFGLEMTKARPDRGEGH